MTVFDYRYDPEAYELEERSRPDELSMIRSLGRRVLSSLESTPGARILDLCCGTGLSMEAVLKHPNVDAVVGVDNCLEYLEFARRRYADHPIVTFLQSDAVDVDLPARSWDAIILCSAYHHIEDARKTIFLRKVRDLLSDRGVAYLGENILPPYELGGKQAYTDSVQLFYREVLQTARTANPDLPSHVEALISRVAQYGVDGDYEYKTSLDILEQHLRSSQLAIRHAEKVWPHSGPLCMTTGGNYVLELVRHQV